MNNVSCPGPVQNVQITVVPTPSVLPIQDIVLCSGEATGLIQILGNANQLNWTSSNPSIGTAARPPVSNVAPSIALLNVLRLAPLKVSGVAVPAT